jgi:hypothetical protein
MTGGSSQGGKESGRGGVRHTANAKAAVPKWESELGASGVRYRAEIQAQNISSGAEREQIKWGGRRAGEPRRERATGVEELRKGTNTEKEEGGLRCEGGMQESLKKWLHGPNLLRGKAAARYGVKANHGAKEGHRATSKGYSMRIYPFLNNSRHWPVRGPEKRRLGKGDGEPRIWSKSAQSLKEDRGLLKRPHHRNIINVGRDAEIIKATGSLLQSRLQPEAEEEGAQHASLSWAPLRGKTSNRAVPIKEMEGRRETVAKIRHAPHQG